jgi:hypothetical protein
MTGHHDGRPANIPQSRTHIPNSAAHSRGGMAPGRSHHEAGSRSVAAGAHRKAVGHSCTAVRDTRDRGKDPRSGEGADNPRWDRGAAGSGNHPSDPRSSHVVEAVSARGNHPDSPIPDAEGCSHQRHEQGGHGGTHRPRQVDTRGEGSETEPGRLEEHQAASGGM